METNGFSTLANALYFIQKARVASQVRKTHLALRKETCSVTEEVLERTADVETWLNNKVKELVKSHPAYPWFKNVKGIGDLNIGKVVSLIDIEKASLVSKLWRYAGMAPGPDGKAERQVSGQKLHYNKVLKSMCWRVAKSLIRAKGSYYEYYREQKTKILARLKREGYTVVPSLELPIEKDPKTGRKKHVEKDGFFGLGHADGMAQRKMIKLFLSHLWLEWRTAEKLPISKPYAHAIQGHSDYRPPEDFIEIKEVTKAKTDEKSTSP